MSDGVGPRARRLASEAGRVVFGPWPIRPLTVGVILAIIYQYAQSDIGSDARLDLAAMLVQLPISLARAAAVVAPMWAMVTIHRRVTGHSVHRLGYLVITIITAVYAASFRFWLAGGFEQGDMGLYGFYVLRAIIMLLTLQTILGIADARLRANERATKRALQLVERQRAIVLDAEERARKEVASFLHDTVQGGLVTVSLQVQRAAEEAPPALSARLTSIVEEMEAIRGIDVRTASRLLSPVLQHEGLDSAVDDLAKRYAPAMTTAVDITTPSHAWSRVQGEPGTQALGAFRLIEQSLLNAAVHGRAKEATLRCTADEEGISIVIADNGRGFDRRTVVDGSGWAIIDAWVGTLGGTWDVVGRTGVGTTVSVRLPFT